MSGRRPIVLRAERRLWLPTCRADVLKSIGLTRVEIPRLTGQTWLKPVAGPVGTRLNAFGLAAGGFKPPALAGRDEHAVALSAILYIYLAGIARSVVN